MTIMLMFTFQIRFPISFQYIHVITYIPSPYSTSAATAAKPTPNSPALRPATALSSSPSSESSSELSLEGPELSPRRASRSESEV